MVQKVDPFVSLNWGWNDGESGWGAGMNENLITYSFFHNRRIQSIIANASLLPLSPVDGEAHFSTADKTVYFRADGVWYFTVPPIGMEFILTTTDTTYKYDGNSLVIKTLEDFGVTPFGSSLLSAVDAPAGRTVLGLGNVDNTSDLNKPVSTATQSALDNKVTTVIGKQLSQEDYTSAEKAKLAGIATSATANSSDATLLARSNHTGTQAISTVTGLQTALDNKLDDSQLGAVNGVAPLGADGKVPSANLPASGSYSGTWNATTNTPTITNGSGTNGQFYIISVAGSTTIDGVSSWADGDQIRFNGTVWQKIPNTNAITSVAGKTGAVTLVPTDVGVNIGTNVQAWAADLDVITALAGTSGLLRKTGVNAWLLDTASYITGNQSITLTGDITGSGTTSIAATLPATGITAGTYKSLTIDSKGRATAGTNPTTLAGYGISDATPSSHIGTGGGSHADATTSVSGFMSGSDKTKLNGVASGATANSADATLLARANHTGTQISSTISDLTETVQDIVGAMFIAGTNTTTNYNDAAGTIAINATASGGSSAFLGLTDTPSAYTTNALKAVRVNAGETALEFVALGTAAFNNTGDFATSSHSHDASAIITGTLVDDRLPSTMSGKTFSSTVNIQSNLNFTGGTQRITADFTNAAHGTRLLFQTSTANASTGVGVIANGTGGGGFVNTYSGSDASNASLGQFYTLTSGVVINSSKTGTGTTQAIYAKIDGVSAATITTARNLLIGTDSDNGDRLQVNGASSFSTHVKIAAGDIAFGGNSWIYSYSGGSYGSALRSGISLNGSAQTIDMYAAGSQRMSLSSGGVSTHNGSLTIPSNYLNMTAGYSINWGSAEVYSNGGESFTLRSGSGATNNCQLRYVDGSGDFQGSVASTNIYIGFKDAGDNLKLYVAHGGDIHCTTNVSVSGEVYSTSTITSNAKILSRFNAGATPTYTNGHLELNNNGSGNPVVLGFHRSGSTACALVHDGGNNLRIDGTSFNDQAGNLYLNSLFSAGTIQLANTAPILVLKDTNASGSPPTTDARVSFTDSANQEVGYVRSINSAMQYWSIIGIHDFGDGDVSAASFTGNGANLTGLNASNISLGTLSDSRLPSALNNKTFTGTFNISTTTPVIIMTATTNPVGAMGNYISFRDNTATEVAWLGFGTGSGEMGFSNSSRNIRFHSPVVVNSDLNCAGAISGNGSGLTSLNASNLSSGTVPYAQLGNAIRRDTPAQTFQSLGTVSGSVSVNGANGTHVLATVNGNTTWTFPSPSSTEAHALTLELTNGGAFTQTWPAGMRWAGGVAPALTASGTDILVFTKAGTNNWRGYLSSKDNK